MADIFLSYKREDVDRARTLVAILEAAGWTVFWDPKVLPGPAFRTVLEKELDAARCVVVLWSHLSLDSHWILDEAESGRARGVLVPVLLDAVRPPLGFRQLQATSLAGWDGDASAPGVDALVRAVTDLIGRQSDLMLWPVDLNLVTGDRERWIDLGPTINMGCRLVNTAQQPLELNRLELTATRGDGAAYELAWHLLYTVEGLEHLKDPREERIRVAGTSTWERGVQFRDTRADVSNIWPAGAYEFELLGWVNRRPSDGGPNVRTRFRAEVDPATAREMTRWRNASAEEWTVRQASDRALGFPLELADVRAGLHLRS
jgi:hypothetical protein